MRRCLKCKKEKENSEFSKNRISKDGLYSYCKACHSEIQKADAYKRKRNEYQIKYRKDSDEDRRKKHLCRQMTSHKIRMGYIKRGVCLICGTKETDAHHLDYNSHENVVWLCKKHHMEAHYNSPLIG